MYLEAGQIVFSPSDLTQYMDSPFASWMEHLALTNPELLPMPDVEDALGAVLQQRDMNMKLQRWLPFQQKDLMSLICQGLWTQPMPHDWLCKPVLMSFIKLAWWYHPSKDLLIF
ncbi:hypothetical protein [Legionella oakridgensis]|uniref:hypothetical protein n=1 Tax=Legionella oakridgensis TaxID=29423 RepID=UPI0004AD45C1